MKALITVTMTALLLTLSGSAFAGSSSSACGTGFVSVTPAVQANYPDTDGCVPTSTCVAYNKSGICKEYNPDGGFWI